MRNAFHQVGVQYSAALKDGFSAHPLAQFIRGTLRQAVSEASQGVGQGFIVNASAGAGNWARIPWVAVFDPLITDSATRGFYVVYLFAPDLGELHLSLNQGTTAVTNEFGSKARSVLRDRAALMRSRLPDFVSEFDVYDLSLGAKGTLPQGYESGHAFGRKYKIGALPDEATLLSDLQRMLQAYLTLTFRGGLDPSIELANDAPSGDQTLMEVRRYRMHRRIDRHPSASKEAKLCHGTTCQACGFDFAQRYGELGAGYIEAHHLRPLSSLDEGTSVSYNVATDFAVLCSNCHRMIHRAEDPSDLRAFRRLIR